MVLWYYQSNHSLPPNVRKKPDIMFTGKLGIIFQDFINIKSATCESQTVRLYQYRLYQFYYHLQRSKQTLAGIDGPYLVRFLSRLDITQKVKEKKRVIEQTVMFLSYYTVKTCCQTINLNIGGLY
jgi:hypothetical protein